MIVRAVFEHIPEWSAVASAAEARVHRHGDSVGWEAAIAGLPALDPRALDLVSGVRVLGEADAESRERLERALGALCPWRKGPFHLFGVNIDAEWRSDWKWARLAPHLEGLAGQSVLDVGCGNGYFGWRLLGAGARRVAGIDPTILYFMQHRAISRYVLECDPCRENWLLPLSFEEVPPVPFDTVLSMGVVYHRHDPQAHVSRLFDFTRPGGRIVVESLVVDAADGLRPAGRYARMRNVPLVPSIALLEHWLHRAGCADIRVVDVSITTTREQRRTPWMTFDSLAEALDPSDPRRTVEGHPAPARAMLIGRRPG